MQLFDGPSSDLIVNHTHCFFAMNWPHMLFVEPKSKLEITASPKHIYQHQRLNYVYNHFESIVLSYGCPGLLNCIHLWATGAKMVRISFFQSCNEIGHYLFLEALLKC